MKPLNLDILINTPKDILVKDVNQIFSDLLNEIQNYLNLTPISPSVIIITTDELKEYSTNLFSLGVRRTQKDNQHQIDISDKYLKYWEFILLREAYLNFVPYELREKSVIQIIIHEIIESDLFKLEVINEWKALVRSNIINYDFLSSQFDKLDKFFKLEGTEKSQSPTQFFFEFIRRNVSLIHDKMDDFYDILFEEFLFKSSKTLFNDEIVETLRILFEIFNQVKLFKNYSEYEEYFQDFKEKGIISTNLSKRKFSDNLRWINRCTLISPSYQQIYHKINICVLISNFRFNPILNRKDIFNILNWIPFLHRPIFTRNGFSEEIHCFFVIPKIYLKDLLNFIQRLNDFGYIINKECYIWKEHTNYLNLNYFREYFRNLCKIVNPNHKDYDNQFELSHTSQYESPKKLFNLTLLEWIIFERVAQFSLTGFGFERRVDLLQSLKDELLNYIESERILISDLKQNLGIFNASLKLKKELLNLLDNNKRFGFFYISHMLYQILKYLDLIEEMLKINPRIKSGTKLRELLNTQQFPQLIEENLYPINKDIQIIVFRDFIPLYFKSIKEYRALKERFVQYLNFFELCRKLKIFSIDSMKEIINNEKLTIKIYSTKETKLKQSFEKFKPYKITNQIIDSIFYRFIEEGLISPLLVSSITTSSFAKYHPVLLVKDTYKVNIQLDKIIKFFPRIFLHKARNLFTNNSIIIMHMYFLNIKEKELFSSIIYNIFREDLISFKRYYYSGLSPFVLIKNFYDFDRDEFFYTKDLFEQSFLYIEKVLGDSLNPLQVNKAKSQEKFWSKDKNIMNLVKKVDRRVSYEQIDYDVNKINELTEFYNNLNPILLEPERFKNYQQNQFFKNYIKSIKFIPNFQSFGLNQYFLYFYPSNIDDIDFKHLLINSFQSIKYPTIIDDSNSFLIKYIFPYNNPNVKHLNWYTKTKRIIQEYCLFSIKSMYQLFNFNYNINVNGWNYDSNRFKRYINNIIFNPDYKIELPKIRKCKMGSLEPEFIDPNSTYFKTLTEIYNWRSTDIKSFLGTQKHSFIKRITELLSKNLIFPYISLKNLGYQDKVILILPDLNKKLNSTILNIFNFFNYGFIYEIEGEYYIHGFDNEIKFDNGFMIKIYLPQCELDEFLKLFDLLFKYLEINYYVFLTDLTKGNSLLKSIYGSLDFLNSYNPLINLKWNDLDKIWINHKIYNEKFEKIYPNLYYGAKKIRLTLNRELSGK